MSVRRPSGEITNDEELAFSEWDDLGKAFETIGFTVVGYDPGIAMILPHENKMFNIPAKSALLIAEALNRKPQK